MAVLSEMAEFLASVRYEDLPEDVREIARKSLLDGAGCGVAGRTGPLFRLQKFVFSTGEGWGESTVLGLDRTASLLGAVLLNGSQIDCLEYSDVNKEVGGHPAAMVLPAALNMAERLGVSGKELLTSIVVGYEAHRVSIPLYPISFQRGIHLCMLGGTFGAAASAARLLRLDAETMADALGLCAVAPVAPFEPCRAGGDVKDLYTGWASRTGVFAALLAESSFSGTPSLAEGELGLYRALGADRPWQDALKGLGREWVTRATCIKPYASCRFTHSSVDAALALVREHALEPGQISRITVVIGTVPYQLQRGSLPEDAMSARFSIPYVIANVIVKGRPVRPQDFGPDSIGDAAVLEMARKVTVELDKSLDEDYVQPPLGKGLRPAVIRMETLGGQAFATRVGYPRGDPRNPVSWAEVQEKFLDLTIPHLGTEKAEKFSDMVNHLEDVANCREFVQVLRGFPK